MKIIVALFLIAITSSSSNMNLAQKSFDYYEGIETAKESNKPIFLFFTGQTCAGPTEINKVIENDKEINLKLSSSFVKVILYVDDETKLPKERKVEIDGKTRTLRTKGDQWVHIEISKYKNNVQPLMVIINSNEEILKAPLIGKATKDDILEYLGN